MSDTPTTTPDEDAPVLPEQTPTETAPDDTASDVAVSTDAEPTADLSSGEGVGDVDADDIPGILDRYPNLPPEVRAALIERHPVDPGAQPNPVTEMANPMPVVPSPADASAANDGEIVRFRSNDHPELIVWHPNGENTIQFHNREFATAQPEWIAVLDKTPEVSRVRRTALDESGHPIEPIRSADAA